jgi:hypothetical protein
VQSHVVAENPAQQPTKHVKEERGGLFIAKSGRDSRKERAEKIEHYFYDLAKEKRIAKDILRSVLELLEKTELQFFDIEKQQYALIIDVFERKIEPVEFVRKWERILFEIENHKQTHFSEYPFDNIQSTDYENLPSLKEGNVINNYIIESILGSGGFGIIYLATNKNTQELFTIKEYKINVVSRNNNVTRVLSKNFDSINHFTKTAELASNIQHPNVIRVVDFFHINQTAYMVMEYVHGINLKQYLSKKGCLISNELEILIESMLNATEAIHALGYLHRDIKPANILIKPEKNFILSDFDTICINPNHPRFLSINNASVDIPAIASSGYSPFEQYREGTNEMGAWTDIYALAATFYTCITGHPPISVFERHDNPNLNIFNFSSSSYSTTILSMIDWGLKMEIHNRPQSISEWRKGMPSKTKKIFSWLNSEIFKIK